MFLDTTCGWLISWPWDHHAEHRPVSGRSCGLRIFNFVCIFENIRDRERAFYATHTLDTLSLYKGNRIRSPPKKSKEKQRLRNCTDSVCYYSGAVLDVCCTTVIVASFKQYICIKSGPAMPHILLIQWSWVPVCTLIIVDVFAIET